MNMRVSRPTIRIKRIKSSFVVNVLEADAKECSVAKSPKNNHKRLWHQQLMIHNSHFVNSYFVVDEDKALEYTENCSCNEPLHNILFLVRLIHFYDYLAFFGLARNTHILLWFTAAMGVLIQVNRLIWDISFCFEEEANRLMISLLILSHFVCVFDVFDDALCQHFQTKKW